MCACPFPVITACDDGIGTNLLWYIDPLKLHVFVRRNRCLGCEIDLHEFNGYRNTHMPIVVLTGR